LVKIIRWLKLFVGYNYWSAKSDEFSLVMKILADKVLLIIR